MPLLVAAAVFAAPRGAAANGDALRGRNIFALAGGCGCHTPENGPVGAGGRALATPFGTFFAPNITPDSRTGIGDWSEAEIIDGIRGGTSRGKGTQAPAMPYYLYAGMADRDVRDLVTYLRTLPPVERENRAHEVALPFQRVAYRAWRFLFTVPQSAPAEAPTDDPIARGRYLADHVAICQDCHTPRGRLGDLEEHLYLAGTRRGPDGKSVPNITPARRTGLADWDVDDLTQLLRSGMLTNFDNVQGLMAEVVDGYGGGLGYTHAPEEDLRAIAQYLKTVPAIEHAVRK